MDSNEGEDIMAEINRNGPSVDTESRQRKKRYKTGYHLFMQSNSLSIR